MTKKNKSKTTSQHGDWKAQLGAIKGQMIAEMTPEEKAAYHTERWAKNEEKRNNQRKLKEILWMVYRFLAGYMYNSGIYVNNFFRGRNFEEYLADKFYDFDFDVKGMAAPYIFDDDIYSLRMCDSLYTLEKNKIAYYSIDVEFIRGLKSLYDAFEYSPRIEFSTVLYRGCSTLARNGVNGIVSATTDWKVAKQFSRGTILKINVPEGTKCLNIGDIRPTKRKRKNNYEKEILLPPCSYEILSKKEVPKKGEPNNIHATTQIIEINVKPLDLLAEFLKMMENPPQEYVEHVLPIQKKGDFEEAKMLLQDYISGKY